MKCYYFIMNELHLLYCVFVFANNCLGCLNSAFQAVLYEKPGFEGSCVESDSEVFSFCESERGTKLKSVASLRIVGGL